MRMPLLDINGCSVREAAQCQQEALPKRGHDHEKSSKPFSLIVELRIIIGSRPNQTKPGWMGVLCHIHIWAGGHYYLICGLRARMGHGLCTENLLCTHV